MKASSTAIQATKSRPAASTMSAAYRVPRPAATEATVIGTATIASSARPARGKLPNGSRLLMVSSNEIRPLMRPTTPAYPEKAMTPVTTAEATRTILPTPAFTRSVFRALFPEIRVGRPPGDRGDGPNESPLSRGRGPRAEQ
jgi:hypothetical protein